MQSSSLLNIDMLALHLQHVQTTVISTLSKLGPLPCVSSVQILFCAYLADDELE